MEALIFWRHGVLWKFTTFCSLRCKVRFKLRRGAVLQKCKSLLLSNKQRGFFMNGFRRVITWFWFCVKSLTTFSRFVLYEWLSWFNSAWKLKESLSEKKKIIFNGESKGNILFLEINGVTRTESRRGLKERIFRKFLNRFQILEIFWKV